MTAPSAIRIVVASIFLASPLVAAPAPATRAQMDRDLLEVTIPRLESYYAEHRYTVRQVTEWYLARIARYDVRYRAIIHVNEETALKQADAKDKAMALPGFKAGPMFGVPMVIKSNTSIEGLITYDGWKGFMLPGHELVAPQDATVIRKLEAAGVILIGQTNMPDFAASDNEQEHRLRTHGQRLRRALLAGWVERRDGHSGNGKLRATRDRDGYRQLDPHALRYERRGGRAADARSGQHRGHRAAGLVAG